MNLVLKTTCVCATVILAFMPAIFGDFISIDDVGMIEHLNGLDGFDLIGMFTGFFERIGFYCRPVLSLTFYVDKELWSFNPLLMRFENLLIHVLSTTILFMFLNNFLASREKVRFWLPMFGALLFGVHPLATESIGWVSGRTDLLSGLFIFFGTYYYYRYRLGASHYVLAAVIVSFFLAVATKEVAYFFPVSIMVMTLSNIDDKFDYSKARNLNKKVKFILIFLFIITFIFVVKYLYSYSDNCNNNDRIGMTLRYIYSDVGYSILVWFKVVGFYVKKIFIPWTLNFAIMEIDPLYEILGMFVVLNCVVIYFYNKTSAALFFSGIVYLSQSYAVSFNNIAWTPYAERYSYVSMWFVIASIVLLLGCSRIVSSYEHLTKLFISIFVVTFFFTTWTRSHVWQSNLSLWEDTVSKSPQNYVALNEYANALLSSGNIEKSLEYYRKATLAPRLFYEEKYEINFANALLLSGNMKYAIGVYENVLRSTNYSSKIALTQLIDLYTSLSKNVIGNNDVKFKLIYYKEKLYDVTFDVNLLISIADDYVFIDRSIANEYYSQALMLVGGDEQRNQIKAKIGLY